MNYKKIVFLKRNDKLVGIGIQENGVKKLLTLDEAIREASVLKKANKDNAIEFLNTKRKLEKAKVEINNEKPKKERIINRKSIAATALALTLAVTGTGYALSSMGADKDATKANTGDAITLDKDVYDANKNNNVVDESTYEEVTDSKDTTESKEVASTSNFDTILNASESETQIKYVKMMSDYINYFNIDFANTYKETVDGVEVKPALSWNYEIPALTIAYNDLSKNEILQIFNGVELNANTLDANYKNATLQLMGAYVVSDSSTPVRLYDLIESAEGKEFVKKYENLFYAIKDAETEELQIEAIERFYEEIYKDYPIDSEMRENGISHMDARTLMDNASYKLAPTAMVAAIEISYQNLEYDRTLSDKAIEYFNDLGMCNIAYEKFQKAEFVLEDSKLNQKYADFGELSKIIINDLKSKDAYVIDDQHRDLSQLSKFQEIVNGHFEVDENGYTTGYFVYNPGSTTTTTTTKRVKVGEWTKTKTTIKHEKKVTKTSDRDKAVDKAGEKKVKEAEDKVNKQIEKENKEAKDKANKEADQKQKEAQKKEDKNKEQKQKEAKEANDQVQKDIKDINDKIDKGEKVNDKDYDGITIDDSHKDKDGNLDNSVKDVTTDSSGANKKLPDPNESGKEFDKKAETKSQSNSQPKAESKQETKKESAPAPKQETKTESAPKQESHSEPKVEKKAEPKNDLPDPNETGKKFDEEANNEMKSQEALISLYIERMANMRSNTQSKAKVLRR